MSQTLKFRICGWGVLLGSTIILAITGVTNWFQGENQGVSAAGKIINSVGSVSVDVMGLLFCGLAAGVCIGTRRWGWAFVFTLCLVLSAGWSANSVYSFRASEQISASATRETANSRVAAADKLQAESARKALDFAKHADTRSARRDFIAGNQDAIKAFRDAEVKVIIPPEAGAQAWADRLGWKLETVQVVQSAYFAFLLIFLKMVGFPGAGFLLSWSPEPTDRRIAGSPEGSGGKGKSEPAREAEIHRFPVKASPELQAPAKLARGLTDPNNVSAGARGVSAPAPRPPVPLNLKPEGKTLAALLAVQPSWPSQKAIADAMGVSEAKVSRDLKKLKGRGKVEQRRNWRSNTIVARRNGGLHATI